MLMKILSPRDPTFLSTALTNPICQKNGELPDPITKPCAL